MHQFVMAMRPWQNVSQVSWAQLSLSDAKCFISVVRDWRSEQPKHHSISAHDFVHMVGALWWAIPMLTTVLWHVQLKVAPESPSLDPTIADKRAKWKRVTDNPPQSTPVDSKLQNTQHNFTGNIWNISTPPRDFKICISSQKSPQKVLDPCNSREECPDEMCPNKPVVQTVYYMIKKGETNGNKSQIQ